MTETCSDSSMADNDDAFLTSQLCPPLRSDSSMADNDLFSGGSLGGAQSGSDSSMADNDDSKRNSEASFS